MRTRSLLFAVMIGSITMCFPKGGQASGAGAPAGPKHSDGKSDLSDQTPVFSPDGRFLAFPSVIAGESRVCIASIADKTLLCLPPVITVATRKFATNAGTPVAFLFGAGHRRLLYSATTSDHSCDAVLAYDIAAGQVGQFSQCRQERPNDIVVSPKGDFVIVKYSLFDDYDVLDSSGSLVGGSSLLTSPASRTPEIWSAPSFLHNRNAFVYTAMDQSTTEVTLFEQPLPRGPRKVVARLYLDRSSGLAVPEPVVSPREDRIALALPLPKGAEVSFPFDLGNYHPGALQYEIFGVDPLNGQLERITCNDADDMRPVWAADGERLYHIAVSMNSGKAEVHSCRFSRCATCSVVAPLAISGRGFHRLAASSDSLAFVDVAAGGRDEVFVLVPNGSTRTRLRDLCRPAPTRTVR
jgi:hypothetical protein